MFCLQKYLSGTHKITYAAATRRANALTESSHHLLQHFGRTQSHPQKVMEWGPYCTAGKRRSTCSDCILSGQIYIYSTSFNSIYQDKNLPGVFQSVSYSWKEDTFGRSTLCLQNIFQEAAGGDPGFKHSRSQLCPIRGMKNIYESSCLCYHPARIPYGAY